MEQTPHTKVIDYLQSLEPEVLPVLQKTDAYRRFACEREKLEKLAKQEMEAKRPLNSPQLLRKSRRVEELGKQVLQQVQQIRHA